MEAALIGSICKVARLEQWVQKIYLTHTFMEKKDPLNESLFSWIKRFFIVIGSLIPFFFLRGILVHKWSLTNSIFKALIMAPIFAVILVVFLTIITLLIKASIWIWKKIKKTHEN